jgi:hypothetical protein
VVGGRRPMALRGVFVMFRRLCMGFGGHSSSPWSSYDGW